MATLQSTLHIYNVQNFWHMMISSTCDFKITSIIFTFSCRLADPFHTSLSYSFSFLHNALSSRFIKLRAEAVHFVRQQSTVIILFGIGDLKIQVSLKCYLVFISPSALVEKGIRNTAMTTKISAPVTHYINYFIT